MQHLGGRALKNDFAALDAGARPHIHNMVAREHHVGVMFHHQHGVAHVTQLFECVDQPQIVFLMQADGRFVKHVQNAHQSGADLRGKPDALALAAGQGGGGARQVQIIHADVEQKLQTIFNFLENAFGNERFLR